MRNHYTDQQLAALLAHVRDGKFNYSSCCCFVGCVTADHALQTIDRSDMYLQGKHLNTARELSGANDADVSVLMMGNGGDKVSGNASRSRILVPMIRAEFRRRERIRQQAEWKQELVEVST
jgi:hypothetical protein